MIQRYIKVLRFVFYPLYFISFFIPRTKTIWVFGAHQNRYAENSKALYLYASSMQDNIKCIWITGDKRLSNKLQKEGHFSYLRWSIKGLYYSLRARYYFYNLYSDDINYYTSGNAIMVNLWHGIPLKKIEFDIKKGAQSKMFNSIYSPIYRFFKPYIFRDPDYVLSTSQTISKLFSSAFRVSEEQCLKLGYPRCDVFYNSLDPDHFTKKHKDRGEKIIIYMPTWRSSNQDFLADAFNDFELLNKTLDDNKLVLYIKLHPNTKTINKQFSNIVFMHSRVDVYEFLPYTDALITDYSSIYFDYILLDKEIVFYAFDYSEYLVKDREMYFNYSDITPGEIVYTFDDLLKILNNFYTLNHTKDRKELRDSLWDYKDGNASQRVFEYFSKL